MTSHVKLAEAAINRIDEAATPRQREAAKRLFSAIEGNRQDRFWIQEGIASTDLPTLLVPALNINFLGQYAVQPVVWDQIVDDTYNAPYLGQSIQYGDFQISQASIPAENDGENFTVGGLPGVAEYGEYPAVNYVTSTLNASLRKGGERFRISWEAILKSGNVDILNRATTKMAQHSAREEDYKLARQFVTVGGVNTTNMTAGRQVTAANAQALNTTTGLAAIDAAKALSVANAGAVGNYSQGGYKLVVPFALSTQAAKVLDITQRQVSDGASGFVFTPVGATTADVSQVTFSALDAVYGGTMLQWFLIPKGGDRPAFIEIFLEGHRTPLISIKDSGHFSLSGGAVPQREGSFDEDDIQTRVRHNVGAAPVDLSGVVWSDGVN